MRSRRNATAGLAWLVLAWLPIWAGCGWPSMASAQSAVQRDMPASFVWTREVEVFPGRTYTWETSDLGSGADPVLHLWDPTVIPLVGPSLELAQDDDGGSGLNARVTLFPLVPKRLVLVMRAFNAESTGTATVSQTINLLGSSETVELGSDLPVGGTRVAVPGGAQAYETAMAAGGALDPKLILLDAEQRILAIDDDGGVGLNARIRSLTGAWAIVTTASPNDTGAVHLYANDPVDMDLDGLGNGLEAALGTCASPVIGGGACAGVFNPQDTDADGLPDGVEVFGLDDAEQPQYLSRWGADPLHKDLFIEVDYREAHHDSAPWDEASAQLAQAMMNDGLASDVGNPDGVDGISLHFDAGANSSNATLNTLLGDWGGSNGVGEGKYTQMPEQERHPARHGIFRYALAEGSGGGQGLRPGDRLHWGGDTGDTERNVRLFLHELGHTLGLTHGGHSSASNANCKPNYRSLMNYTFMYKAGTRFSQGAESAVLDPSFVAETIGLSQGSDPSYLAGQDYNRTVTGLSVDWDFSGDFWRPVRAPVTFSTNESAGGCSVSYSGAQSLAVSAETTSSPTIARAFNRLYVFWVTSDHRIGYRSAVTTAPDNEGSCPGPGTNCAAWSDGGFVNTDQKAFGISAAGWDDGLVLVYRTENWAVRERRAKAIDVNDYPAWETENAVPAAVSTREPELVPMRVDPRRFGANDTALGLFALSDQGNYRWHTLTGIDSAWTSRGQMDLRNADGDLISGRLSPTLESWPPWGVDASGPVTCGVFSDDQYLGYYCYDPATHRWELMSNAFRDAPRSWAKPGLEFRVLRDGSGGPQQGNETRGQMWLTTVGRKGSRSSDINDRLPRIWISTTHDALNNVRNARFDSDRRALVGNLWTKLHDGTGVMLYSDLGLLALKGALWQSNGKVPGLKFLPLADGTFKANLRDLNDFRVMHRGTCLGLHGWTAEAYCGPATSSPWGL